MTRSAEPGGYIGTFSVTFFDVHLFPLVYFLSPKRMRRSLGSSVARDDKNRPDILSRLSAFAFLKPRYLHRSPPPFAHFSLRMMFIIPRDIFLAIHLPMVFYISRNYNKYKRIFLTDVCFNLQLAL